MNEKYLICQNSTDLFKHEEYIWSHVVCLSVTCRHFVLFTVAAFTSSPWIAALWKVIQHPSGCWTIYQIFPSEMNSGAASE